MQVPQGYFQQSSIDALNTSHPSPWSGGFRLITIEGKPVIEYLKVCQMDVKQFFSWLFGFGEFSAKKLFTVLSNDEVISSLAERITSQVDVQRHKNLLHNIDSIEKRTRGRRKKECISKMVMKRALEFLRSETMTLNKLALTEESWIVTSLPTTTSQEHKTGKVSKEILSETTSLQVREFFSLISREQVFSKINDLKKANGSNHSVVKILDRIFFGLTTTESKDKIFTPQAFRELSWLQYLISEEVPLNSFDQDGIDVEKKLQDLVKKKFDDLKKQLYSQQSILVTAGSEDIDDALKSVKMPLVLAKALILPDGTINQGLIDDLIDYVLPTKNHRDCVEKDAIFALRQFRDDGLLQEKVRGFPQPKVGTPGERMIRATLQLPTEPLSQRDLSTACLSACLSSWRQHSRFGNCYAVAFTSHLKDASLHLLVDDLTALVREGAITRSVSGGMYRYYGLERMIPDLSIRKIGFSNLSSFMPMPGFKNALHAIGVQEGNEGWAFSVFEKSVQKNEKGLIVCDLSGALTQIYNNSFQKLEDLKKDVPNLKQELSQGDPAAECSGQRLLDDVCRKLEFTNIEAVRKWAIEQTKLQGKWTLERVINFLHSHYSQLKSERLRQAINYVEATVQSPLLRWHENAVASMLVSPFTAKSGRLLQEKVLRAVLMKNCFEILKNMKGDGFASQIRNAMKKFSRDVLESNFDVPWEDMSLKYDKLLDAFKGKKSLAAFDSMRCCFTPRKPGENVKALWTFCREQDGGVTPLTEETFGKLLREMTFDVVSIIANLEPDAKKFLQGYLEGIEDKKYIDEFLRVYLEQASGRDELVVPSLEERELLQEVHSCISLRGEEKISSVNIEEVYSFYFEKQEEIPLQMGRKSILSIAALGHELAAGLGEDSRFSALVQVDNHILRFIPNHPTLRGIDEDWLKQLETNMTSFLKEPISKFPETIKYLEGFLKHVKKTGTSVTEGALQMFKDSSQTLSSIVARMKQELGALWGSALDARGRKSWSKEEMDHIDVSVLVGLMQDRADMHQLIHFADTNWTGSSLGEQQAVHFCFWFNPFEEKWQLVSAPENENPHMRFGFFTSSKMQVRKVSTNVLRAVTERSLLHRPRQIAKRISQIEDAFVEAYKQLGNEPIAHFQGSLPSGLWSLLRRAKEVIERRGMAPPERCAELRAIYAAIQKRCLEITSARAAKKGGVITAYRISRFGDDAKCLKELDESF